MSTVCLCLSKIVTNLSPICHKLVTSCHRSVTALSQVCHEMSPRCHELSLASQLREIAPRRLISSVYRCYSRVGGAGGVRRAVNKLNFVSGTVLEFIFVLHDVCMRTCFYKTCGGHTCEKSCKFARATRRGTQAVQSICSMLSVSASLSRRGRSAKSKLEPGLPDKFIDRKPAKAKDKARKKK